MAEEEKEKKDMQFHVGLYAGKEYRRKFEKEVDGNKVEVKVYGIKIKQSEQQQFGKSFTIFSTTKGFDTIEEGDWVKLGYVVNEFERKDGQKGTSHLILWIGKTEDRPEETTKINLSNFDDFKTAYLSAMKEGNKEPDSVHMLGSYIATYEADKYKELMKKCNEALQ